MSILWKDQPIKGKPKPLEQKTPAPAPVPADLSQWKAPPEKTAQWKPAEPVDGLDVYPKLLQVTDFDATDAGVIIKKYIDPLNAVPMDERVRFGAALALAKSHEGLTEEKIKATFVILHNVLAEEQKNFEQAMAETATEVGALKATIQQTEAQLAAQRLDLKRMEDKLSGGRSTFESARQRRELELNNLQSKYISKG